MICRLLSTKAASYARQSKIIRFYFAVIERELASRADQGVLRWFGHVERMDDYRMARRVLMTRSQWETGTRDTEAGLDGRCDSGLRQQRNDGGGCHTTREKSERVVSPGTYN